MRQADVGMNEKDYRKSLTGSTATEPVHKVTFQCKDKNITAKRLPKFDNIHEFEKSE